MKHAKGKRPRPRSMKIARIGELRDGLSRYLKYVRAGGTVMVYDRETPIAEIIPLREIHSSTARDRERIARLVKAGVVTAPVGNSRESLKDWKPVKVKGSVLQALLEERESGW